MAMKKGKDFDAIVARHKTGRILFPVEVQKILDELNGALMLLAMVPNLGTGAREFVESHGDAPYHV